MATTSAVDEIYTVDLEALPIVYDGPDIPDEFFEDFEKNDFLDGFEVLDDLSPTDDSLRKCLSALSSASSKLGLDKNQSEIKELEEENVQTEIKKLEEENVDVVLICDTPSPVRSPSSRSRSLSRPRRYGGSRSRSSSRNRRSRSRSRSRRSRSRGRRSRTRSRGRRRRTRSRSRRSRSRGRRSRSGGRGGRRIRLRSRDRRTKSRGRPSRSPIELPSLSRRPKPKSRDKGGATGTKPLSFLEELSLKFAEQGKAFPEAEAFDINAMNNYEVRSNPFASSPLYNQKVVQPSEWVFNNVTSVPRGIKPAMTKSMHPTSVTMNLESSNSNSREAPPSIKPVYENYNSRFCDTDEIIRKMFREAVITRCRDVVNLLKAAEAHLFEPQNLQFIPTVISASLPNDTHLSPLETIHNVEFSFNNVDKAPSYIKRLSKDTSNIVHTLGFNMKTAQFPVQNSLIDDSDLLPDDTMPIKFDIGAQTEPVHCVRCLKHDMREVEDKTTQVAAITYHIACQTSNEDMYSFSDMTPAQLIAMNDFAKILKTGLTPTNYREATDLRDRLFNIYQTCTDFSKNSFMHDNENQINPAIFRDRDDRVPEPVVVPRIAQNNLIQQDCFDNRQMDIGLPRQFELNRTMDRGEQIFSRPSDLFQSNSTINSTIIPQDRFIQMQNKERFDFDLNIQQGDQFILMHNSDPRCTQQQQMQNLNDFGVNRMPASMNISPNLFDSTQDSFTNILKNQQQELLSNIIWGQGLDGGALSSLSSISANYLRGQAPQPLFPELANGNIEIDPGPNLQSINQENNPPFDNDYTDRKKTNQNRRTRRVKEWARSKRLKRKLEQTAKSK